MSDLPDGLDVKSMFAVIAYDVVKKTFIDRQEYYDKFGGDTDGMYRDIIEKISKAYVSLIRNIPLQK